MCNTSFNLNSSLSSNDNAACAFRDSLPDPSEKLSTFLSTLPLNEEVRFLFPIFVHMSVFCSVVLLFRHGRPSFLFIQGFNSTLQKSFLPRSYRRRIC